MEFLNENAGPRPARRGGAPRGARRGLRPPGPGPGPGPVPEGEPRAQRRPRAPPGCEMLPPEGVRAYIFSDRFAQSLQQNFSMLL